MRLALLTPLLLLLSGCPMARVDVQELPVPITRAPSQPGSGHESVPVYDPTISRPTRAGIPIAQMGAHGNGYADREFLRKKLGEKGAELGADFVTISSQNVEQGPTVTSFGYYTAVSQTIHTLSVYAVAWVYAPARLGATAPPPDFVVKDIAPDGPCGRAGIRIGDRILAINGERLMGRPLGLFHALAGIRPGDTARVEIISPNSNQQRMVDVVAAPNN